MRNFIPKPPKTTAITMRLDEGKQKKLDAMAKIFNISRSQLICQCVDYALENMEPSSKKEEDE